MENEINVSIIPNWEVDSPYYHFDVYAEGFFKGFFSNTVIDSKLFDIIEELSCMADEYDINVYVYAYYNGDKNLIKFYNELISIFDNHNFHLEYEHG